MKKTTLFLILFLLLAGCSQNTEVDDKKDLSLTIGVMPSLDAAPILLAEEKGYFKEEGLTIDVHIYTNGNDRESEMNSGLVDGIVTDILGLINSRNADYKFKATSSTDTLIPLLVNPESKDKKDVRVGMAEVSVTNYLAQSYLKDFTVTKEFIDAIPQRLEMVQSGIVDMAIVPEPMASQGELNGLRKEVYTSEDKYSPNVLVFSQKTIDTNSDALQAFYKAYNKAVEDINKDDTEVREVLVKRMNLNPEIKDLITLPSYSKAQLFDEAYYQVIRMWIKDNLKIETEFEYKDVVEAKFIQ